MGRFIDNGIGSSFLRPLHGSRHRASQMKFFSGFRFFKGVSHKSRSRGYKQPMGVTSDRDVRDSEF